MTRTSRIALLTLTTLVAACIFSVALFAQSANADVTPTLTATYADGGSAGTHSNYTQALTFGNGSVNVQSGEDIRNLAFDYPAGLIGDPNAVPAANRCNFTNGANTTPIDYNGGTTGYGAPGDVSPSSGSPDYKVCGTSDPNSQVGSITVSVTAVATVFFIPITCNVTLTGGIYLLQNRPTANPEVPTYLGIHVEGSAGGICALGGTSTMDMTAKITLRPSDNGLRVVVVDDLPRSVSTAVDANTEIRLDSVSQTINGMAPGGRPFLTEPTRCDAWTTKAYARGWVSNGNVDSDVNPVDAVNEMKADAKSTTPDCGNLIDPAPTFSLANSPSTATQAGAPTGLRATLSNPIPPVPPGTGKQPAYAKEFSLLLPVGYKINPTIANRLGGVGGGCTEAQFLMPTPGTPVSDLVPTCPATSEIGTVAVSVPEITGDLVGKLYLGEPRPGDEAAGIYRLYIQAVRGGVSAKFQGTATANAGNGQVTVSIKNISSYNAVGGLPQFNYTKFDMDFNSASTGIGTDASGSPVSNPVASPNAARQMLLNPQVCGVYTPTVTVKPWTSPNQGDSTPTVPALNVTAGTNGSCNFLGFNPTVAAKLRNVTDTADLTDAGSHPDLTITATRPDRMDNIRDLVIDFPSGFAGSAAVVSPANLCTPAQASSNSCPVASRVGTVQVLTGGGSDTAALNGTINMATTQTGDTATLAVVVPAQVGPFNLGNVVLTTHMTIPGGSNFSLRASTTNMPQSILGIPILYRSIAFKLNGTVNAQSFLTVPSTCGQNLNFATSITSNGDAPGPAGAGVVSTTTPSASAGTVTNCAAAQGFAPTVTIDKSDGATGTYQAGAQTGINVTVNSPVTTPPQSTIKKVDMTFPSGMEINPAFAANRVACPTATINAITSSTSDGCASGFASSQIGTVTVNTPLLATAVPGLVYLEQPGATRDTRYKIALVLFMPGGVQIVHGSTTIDSGVAGSTAAVGATGLVNTGTGQIKAVFDNLPDVPYTSMVLKFSDATRPQMFVNPTSCGAKTWATIVSPTNTSKAAVNLTPGYTTTDSNCAAVNSAWAPTFGITTTDTVAGAHPNVSMTITRPDLNQQLRDVVFDLPVGFTGAPAATDTPCSQASADAATCATTAASSSVGSVTVKIGSGASPATVTGGIYNTVAPSTAPAKLTAVVPVTIGPFALGNMSVPVDVSMNDNYSLRASVLNLPSRYEGIAVRYQELKVTLNGMTTDNKPFLTNPSTCPGTAANFTASVTSSTPTTSTLTQPYPVTACGNFTAPPNGAGVAVSGLSTTQQTPTGMNVNVTNTLSTAVINPTIKRVQIAFPAGFTLNPAIGNNASNTTCASGNFSLNAAPTCPAQSKIGTVSLVTPLLKNSETGNGSWPGSVYLTTPGSARETRYQIKIVIPIPGKYIVISGSATADAGAVGTVGPTGLTDTGTGAVSADFNNLPDLGFTSMAMTFDASASGHQLIVTPSTQVTGNVVGTVSPNTGGTAVTQNSGYTGAAAAKAFSPTFSASLSSVAAGASPTLTAGVTNAGTNVKQLRNFNMHLPTGLVANTAATATRCTQADANAANCAGTSSVGTITTVIGPTASENYSLPGTLYNVDPSSNEPARLQAIIPVNVGPYSLGSLSVPVTTAMRSDNGIDTMTTLPRRYEGIDVFVRSLSLVINAPNYLINPSACGAAPITADFIAGDGGTVSGVAASPTQTIGSCARNYGTAPTLSVTPSTTETAKPTGLTFTLGSTITNPTTQSVAMTFPLGIEFNPAGAAALGAAGSCPLATVQTNAASCPALSVIGSTTLNTPLLANPVLGTVYLETPGTTATTRYKANIALNIPGRAQPLVIQGSIQVNGSTTIASGGLGSTDATGTATGRITANFTGIPDLGFTSMVVALTPQAPNASNPPLFVNPTACATSTGFSATFTPYGTGTAAAATGSYNTDNTNCGSPTAFTPGFSFTPTTSTPASHPDLTMNFTRPDFNRSVRSLTVSLPTGLVAATSNAAQCALASADAGNCATTPIGTADTTFGSGSTASASGTVYNVTPSSSNEPARFQAIMPVTVGPFSLGKLSVPISTSLRSDFGIDASATLPVRFEGIAVRLRTLSIKLLGSVGSSPVKNFLTMPSNCAATSLGWSMTSDGVSPATAANTSALTISGAGCSTTFPTAPTMTVTPTSGSTTLAAEPVNLTFGIHSDANNPTIKRVGLTFPSGMEINPGFANIAAANALTCPTATINSITTTDACATGFPSSKLANITMVTPLLATNPTGAVYLESPGSTEASRYRVVMVINLPGRYLVVRGSINVPGDTTIAPGGTGAVGGSGGPITADFDNIPDLGFTDLTLAFNSSKPLVVNPETCTAGNFSGAFYPWSSGIQTTVTSAWTSTSCAAPTPFDPSFSVQVNGGTSAAAASHPNLTLAVARADKSKSLAGMTISLPQGLAANTGQVTNCPNASAVAATCATTTPYSQVGTFSASFGSGTGPTDPYSLSTGKLFQTVPQTSSEPVRFQAILPVVVGPFDLGNMTIPVSSSLRSDFGIDITTSLPTRYEGISVRIRTMSIAMNGTVSTGPSSTTSYIVAPSKCQTNNVSATFTAGDASSDTNNGNNSSNFTTTGCTTTAPAYSPTVAMTNSPTTAGNPTAVGLTFNVPADNSTTSQVVTKFPAGMELNPGAANDLTACTSFDPINGPSCPNSSLLGSVTLTTPLLPTAQTGSIYVESPGNTAGTRYRLVLAIQLPGRWLIIHGGALVAGSTDIPTASTTAIGSTADTGVANGEVTATFPGLPDLGFSSLAVQFKNSGAGSNLFVNPKTCSTTNVLTATMTPTNTAMAAVNRTANFTTAGGTCGTTGFSPTFSGTLAPSPAASGSNPNINLNVANPLGTQELRNLSFTLPTGLVANTTAVTQCTPAQASSATCPAGTMVGSTTTSIGSSDTAADALEVTGTIYNATPSSGEVARLQVVLPVLAGPYNLGNLSIPVPVTLNPDLSVTASAALPSRYEGIAVRIRGMAMTVLGTPNGNKFVIAPSKCQTNSAISARITSDSGTISTVVSPSTFDVDGCPKNFVTTPSFSVTPSTTVRGAPVNLGFSVLNSATNPTVSRIRMTLPSGMEINPAFGNNLAACATGTINSGGASCPVASRVGTVSMTTPLLSGTYLGNVYLEEPGNSAATRYKLAIVVNLPGQPLIVRGAITVDGTSNIPTAATGATGSIDSGTNPIVADFDSIPDLGFSNLTVNFSSTNPMLINPTSCSSQTFQAQFTPHSNGVVANQSASYSTTPVGCQTSFAPNFTATTTNGSSIAAGTVHSASNPGLKLHVDRPADGDTYQNYLRNFNLQLPVGMAASTTATATTCSQANASAGNCTSAQRVGTFATSIGNGTGDGTSTDTTNLFLNGGIYNVTPTAGTELARLAAITPVLVGPYNLGNLVIPITTALRSSDYGVNTFTQLPSRYEGIAVRVKSLDITLDGWVPSTNKPFMIWPSRCAANTVTADMISNTAETATGTGTITTNSGCTAGFGATPTLAASATPTTTSKPTGLGLTVGSAASNPTISRVQMTMPTGMSINPAVGKSALNLTCATATINAGGAGCPALSQQGTVTLNTPLLQAPATGKVFLETPTDMTPANRYKLAIVVDLPGSTDLILHGSVGLAGSTAITGGTGATDSGTGIITADFNGIPDLGFTSLDIAFATGGRALLTNSDSCGTQTVAAKITPTTGGADANVSGAYTTTGTGTGCASTETFDPTFAVQATTSTVSGANTNLKIDVTTGITNDSLRNFNLKLPAGLVAATAATTTTCTPAEAVAATCTDASRVGTIDTELGTGTETLPLSGKIFNVTPGSNEPAHLAAIIPVVVGPYDLGKLSIPVSTSLRSTDYGVDTTTQIPYRYEGIAVKISSMSMTLFGTVDQNTVTTADDAGFIKNPSQCDPTGSTRPFQAVLSTLGGSTVTKSANYPVIGCPRNFSPNPTLTVSNTTNQTAVPTGMTLQFDSSASNPTIGSVDTTMPLGMTLNPAVANLNGGINACPFATVEALKLNPNATPCPAASKVGDVSLITPLLPGTKTGAVYLEEPGNTAATRYKLVMIVDLPGTKLVVRGSTTVDGSSDLTGGLGATDGGSPTGRIAASFNSIPDLGFTQLTIAFSGGANALFTNSETAGTQTVEAEITPQSGGSTISASDSFSTVYGGSGSQGSEPFDPTFNASFSTFDAAANPDVTITVTRDDYTQQIEDFDLHLPPGLVANTVLTPRCEQIDAAAGACDAESAVGSVTTKIGTGSDQLTMNGTLYNVIPDADEPARLAVVMAVQVGPYNLGKLSLPVTTEIVSGAQASDLSIDTHTTLPKFYEGVPVRLRELQIQLDGIADQGTPGDTSDDQPFMINPSQCTDHTLMATMKSTLNNSVTVGSPGGDFTTVNCENAPYNPAMTAELSTTERGKPVGIDLGFEFSGNSSSTKKIVTTFPAGMAINPGVGNYGTGMTCDDALVQAGGANCPGTYLTDPDGAGSIEAGDACVQSDAGCHIASKLGSVALDTPLLPTTQTGALYLLPPVGNQAATRYRLGLFVDLPGAGDLYTTGSVTVDGSSDVPTGGTGAVDSGDGQVTATFDNLPDLQFNKLTLSFKTTGAGEHALLTNPNTCGTFDITADMSPWARPTTSEQASTSFTTTDTVASCIETESGDQPGYVSAELGEAGPDFNNPAGPAYFAGASQPVTMTVNRPDSDKTIKRVKFLLPPGLVGSADAAPTCSQVSADAGTCTTSVANNASQIGTVTLKIGDSSDTYEITGGLFNTDAPSNRPAKFTFIADVNVGPFAFGKVIVPVDVNLDNNDYSLFAETGDMPQVFEGIPVRISQMTIALVGTADQGTPGDTSDDKVFMSNPRSCSTTLNVRAVITSSPGNTTKNATAPLAGPFTNCANLNLDANTVTIENEPVAPETGHGAEHPTGLNVQVHQDENLATQATLKELELDLPGFRLSAPAANGLQACTASQLNNETCPAESRVGTAWLDTSLLPKNQTSPDGPGTHSLWGAVYLETPGNAADGSDRYKLAIQLTGKTLITIRGIARVNETTGEITTKFEGLPDIPFTDFRVELTGYKKTVASVTTYFPLLLNPVGVVGSASTVQANANLTPHSGTAPVTRSATLPIDAALAKTFTPTTSSDISPLTSGGHPNAAFNISRGDGQEDIKNVAMQLPAGFLGSASAVPLCPLGSASAGTCNDQSKVGEVVAEIGQFGQKLTLPGTIYLTEGVGGDIAGMSIKVPAKAGPYDLGDFITQGRIQIRPTDHGITVNFVDVPKLFKGVPTHIQNMDISLPGITQSTQKPFLYNASDCSPFSIVTSLTPYAGAVVQDSDPYQATGCPSRAFNPSISFAATSAGDDRTAPSWQIKLNSAPGNSTLKSTTVLLPSIMTVNVQGIADACPPEQVNTRTCPASSVIGTVSINTPLLTAPVTGTIYMAKSISGQSLPDMLIDIPAPIDMQVRGANSFVTAGNAASQIKSTFTNLPDLIWGDMTMNITGGPKGILGLRANGKCGSASSSFTSHSGQAMSAVSQVSGIEGYCQGIAAICQTPTVKLATKGVKKNKYKKATTKLSLVSATHCAGIKAVRVTYPKGTKINRKLLKYKKLKVKKSYSRSKKAKIKKQQKAYNKNLRNITGGAGTTKLRVHDYAVSGRTGLKIKKTFPTNARSFSINTKKSAVVLPYKTFCGKITKKLYTKKYAKKYKKKYKSKYKSKLNSKYKKDLKKCQKKKVTFTFEITNDDGTAFRYKYSVAAGSKFFK